MKVYDYILEVISSKGAAFFILIDPDKIQENKLQTFIKLCEDAGVDAFLAGGSLMINDGLSDTIRFIKTNSKLPVIIFPGEVNQVYPEADAILFISLISGRNPDSLIGRHVMAAPLIHKYEIEPISTGYMLIESGRSTTAEYISGSKPIPRDKPEIAGATALAAQYLGMKLIYLEAGSGAEYNVPVETVKTVSSICSVPVIVGGGIRDTETVKKIVQNGAKIIVIGNFFENESNWNQIEKFASAVHNQK